MFNDPFIIAMDDGICRMACLYSVAGALCIRSVGWLAAGWALVVLGMLSLWLAHQFAVAPLHPDPTT